MIIFLFATLIFYQSLFNAKHEQYYHFFFIQIVNVWNHLPKEIVSASSLSLFKLHIKKFDLHAIASLVF